MGTDFFSPCGVEATLWAFLSFSFETDMFEDTLPDEPSVGRCVGLVVDAFAAPNVHMYGTECCAGTKRTSDPAFR